MATHEQEQVTRDLRLCDSLLEEERKNRAHWEPIMKLVMPELLESAENEDTHKPKDKRICGHAQTDILKLASAHGSFITPMAQKWFQYAPWYEQNITEQEWANESSWYSKCTEIAHGELHKSNFYTELHATNIDRCGPGSGLMLAEGDENTPLTFVHIPIGTYGWAENSSHEICTVVRKMKMTPAQMVDQFGEAAVGQNVMNDYHEEGKRYATTSAHVVYHLVEPRLDGVRASMNLTPDRMPFRSVYIDVTERKILREGGYYEFPYFATRFNRFGVSPYGRSPLAGVIDDIKDLIALKYLNFLNAQKKTIPPLLISPELEGEVDSRAGGVTIVSPQDVQAGLPREWASAGDIREALQQIEEKKQAIDSACYVDVIQAVTQTTKQMTATEVNALETERLLTFSPSFMQYVTDFRAMNDRIFCILVRQGKIDIEDAPEEIRKYFPEGEAIREQVLPPNVSYIGKMAQTIQQVQQSGLKMTIQELVTLARETGSPEWTDPINIESTVRWLLNAAAVPWRCTNTPGKVKAIQQQRAAAQQAQMEAALAEQASMAQRNMAAAAQ